MKESKRKNEMAGRSLKSAYDGRKNQINAAIMSMFFNEKLRGVLDERR